MSPHFEGETPDHRWIAVPGTQHKCDPEGRKKRTREIHAAMVDVAYPVREVADGSGLPCTQVYPRGSREHHSPVGTV